MMNNAVKNQNYIKKNALLSLINNNQGNENLFIGYKNHELVIQETTEALVLAAGLKKVEQICGLTDFEIPHPSVTLAESYIAEDRKVLNGYKLTILDAVPLNKQTVIAVTTRIPVVNHQFAIIGSAFFINRISNDSSLSKLAEFMMQKKNDLGISLILTEENILAEEKNTHVLSEREFEILWLLARGVGIKKISTFFCRSPRTIEDHVNNIKIKYNCYTKAELIEKAIDNSILNCLPVKFAKSNIANFIDT